jgi:hypothetical protein
MLDRKGYRYSLIGLAAAETVFLIAVGTIVAVGHEVPKELWTLGTALAGGLLGVLVPRPQATSDAKRAAESAVVHSAASQAASEAAEHLTASKAGTNDGAVAAAVRKSAQGAVEAVQDDANLKGAIAAASPSPAGSGAAAAVLALQHGSMAKRKTKAAKASGLSLAEEQGLKAEAEVFKAAAAAATMPETMKAAKVAVKAAPAGGVKGGDYFAKLIPPLLVLGIALYLGTKFTDKAPNLPEYEGSKSLAGPHLEAAKAYLSAVTSHYKAVVSEGNALLALAAASGGSIVGVLAPSPGEKSPGESKPSSSSSK